MVERVDAVVIGAGHNGKDRKNQARPASAMGEFAAIGRGRGLLAVPSMRWIGGEGRMKSRKARSRWGVWLLMGHTGGAEPTPLAWQRRRCSTGILVSAKVFLRRVS